MDQATIRRATEALGVSTDAEAVRVSIERTVEMARFLRYLNERQAGEGVARLRADLEAMRRLGIVDARGRRIRRELPAEMSEGTSDVV